jgi:hypothetical protein
MARIPTEELERLKTEVSVEHLVAASGVDLKAAGKDLLGRCPFHEDREASLVVNSGMSIVGRICDYACTAVMDSVNFAAVAPVAQLDRALRFERSGRRFESVRARISEVGVFRSHG